LEHPFPKWRYHRTHPAFIAQTPEDGLHEEGWRDTPAAFHEPEPALAPLFEPAKKTKKTKE